MNEHQGRFYTSSFSDLFSFDFTNLTFTNVISALASTSIIFGGVIPYFPQYMEIHNTGNADGFSIYVCLVLLLANILRIIFWFGYRFEIPLLAQSVIMIVTMFALVELCVRTKNRNTIGSIKNRYFFGDSTEESRECLTAPNHEKLVSRQFWDLQAKYFWQWTDFISYLECMATISLIAGIAMYLFIENWYFVQGTGLLALLIESGLGMPQLYRNHKNRSTVGMNRTMVLLWLAGDLLKTVYYIIKDTPIQFWICGFIQITVDILILLQGFFFKRQERYTRRIDKDYK